LIQAADPLNNVVSLRPQPRIYARAEHPISRKFVSESALKVLYRLDKAGFQAFLVGGSVRDLLLGREPKDFDVATNALPEQVRELFRNCRLIGRRFRLAHVQFGREIIEVATFRGQHEGETEAAAVTDQGRILRDNVYGTLEEDVWRRDFTCNALYYNIADFSVWDYVEGSADIAARRLRLIGDPETRFREDPVRMLRAARFEAKLGFGIEPAAAEALVRLKGLLGDVPPARLFDEMVKLFLTGHGRQSLEVLRRRALLEELLPNVARYFATRPAPLVERLLEQGLRNTDERVAADKPVTPTFLLALLLYGPIAAAIEASPPERWHETDAILDAVEHAVRGAQGRVTIPKRFSLGVRELFALQPRLEHPRGRRALRLLEHPRFRAAYDLLVLRAGLGLAPRAMADWWTRVQQVSPEERGPMADELARTGAGEADPKRGSRRRRPRRRKAGARVPDAS